MVEEGEDWCPVSTRAIVLCGVRTSGVVASSCIVWHREMEGTGVQCSEVALPLYSTALHAW